MQNVTQWRRPSARAIATTDCVGQPSLKMDIIDLSHWQAPVDFTRVKAAGIGGVILKATQGSGWIDPTFVSRALAATQAGLPVGAYHFLDDTDPAAQAAFFLSVAAGMPVLALDIEANGAHTVSIAQAEEMVSRVQIATGRCPLVYMTRYGPAGDGSGLPSSVLARCSLWLAEYGDTPIPPPGWAAWTFWQYTETAQVAGIGDPCDLSHFAGADLSVWWK